MDGEVPYRTLLRLWMLLLFLAGCVHESPLEREARRNAWQVERLPTTEFSLQVVRAMPVAPSPTLRVYLGSDGVPWQGRQPSTNPEGRSQLALALMAQDNRPSVFLGRPCYPPSLDPELCRPVLWTAQRYAQRIVDSMDKALSILKTQHAASELELVGLSGGGVLALLLASQRDDVSLLVTLAAPLDTEAWIDFHGFLPLTGSLNPATLTPVRSLPRHLHFHGDSDAIVPAETLGAFFAAYPASEKHILPGFSHACCWQRDWPTLLQRLAVAPSPR